MSAGILIGLLLGLVLWLVRTMLPSLFTVNQNERAVKTSFGKAIRIGKVTTLDDPISMHLRPEERERYVYPQVQVIPPGGPYLKFPWEKVYKVPIAIQTVSLGAILYLLAGLVGLALRPAASPAIQPLAEGLGSIASGD